MVSLKQPFLESKSSPDRSSRRKTIDKGRKRYSIVGQAEYQMITDETSIKFVEHRFVESEKYVRQLFNTKNPDLMDERDEKEQEEENRKTPGENFFYDCYFNNRNNDNNKK